MGRGGAGLQRWTGHRQAPGGTDWTGCAQVAADGGEIVAFEIEEAPGEVEGVRWIQEQAEAGDTVRLRFFQPQMNADGHR